jgi:hypothetical protein
MLWLREAKKVALLGGYGYESGWGYYPAMYKARQLDAWTYDAARNAWELAAAWDKDCPPAAQGAFPIRAAAGADDVVTVVARGTWQCRLDVSKPDAAGAARLGAKPGAIERRKQYYDPEWYKGAGPGDPAKVEAELAALPANTWTLRPQPNRPQMDVCWGTGVYSPDLDLIMRFSGGHCVYGGTAPQVYDLKTDRWSIPFAPEMYLEYCASNGGLLDGWSFSGSPWMPGHSYNATAYEPESKTMVYVSIGQTFFFDPVKGRWSRAEQPNPFYGHQHVTTLASTPRGLVARVGKPGYENFLYALDAKARTWSRLPLKAVLPATGAGDQHGMVYDAKRDRLLFFSAVDKNKGDVMAYDFKSGEGRWLGAAGKTKAAVGSRNTLYLPVIDAVLIGNHTTGEGGKKLWPLYDCEKNAWFGIEWAGEDPMAKTQFFSLAVMLDARRKMLWTVDNVNRVHALKLDAQAAKLQKLD